MSTNPQIRVLCTLPLERAKQCIKNNEMVTFGVLPPAVERFVETAKRPRMPMIASAPEPTQTEVLLWCMRNGVDMPPRKFVTRTFVLAMAKKMEREPVDIVSEMLGHAKLKGDNPAPLAAEYVQQHGFDPGLMLVMFVPLEDNSPTNPDEWFSRPRCERCNWPLADSEEAGCVVGNCSMRGAQ